MRLTVLGSGTCVPSVERNAPGYHLEIGGTQVLVDCGSGTVRQLEQAGRSCRDISFVFISHTHPDHVADLLPLLHALVSSPGYVREMDLVIVGPSGMGYYYDHFVSPLIREPDSFKIEVREMERAVDFGDFHVASFKTVHSYNSIAYRFARGEKSIVVTGDCDFHEDIVSLSRGADLLVIDCSYPDALKVPGHLTPAECGMVANKAGVKKVILSHIYPTKYPDGVRLEEFRAVCDGEVEMAYDLMEVAV
jgi:ribonuclease BN (tRNA processing enzyme)